MSIKLNSKQKDALNRLLSPQNSEDLFNTIEYKMREPFLPEKGSQTNVLKQEIKSLQVTAELAKNLKAKLQALDQPSLIHINTSLAHSIGAPYHFETIKVGDQDVKLPSLPAKQFVEVIEKSVLQLSRGYAEDSKTYMGWSIRNLAHVFLQHKQKITASVDSDFVEFVAIVLEEESYDKICKQVSRSNWFKSHRNDTE